MAKPTKPKLVSDNDAPKKAAPKKPAAKKAPAKKVATAKKPATKKPAAKADVRSSAKAAAFIDSKAPPKKQTPAPKHNENGDLFDKLVTYFDEWNDIQKDITKLTGKKGASIKEVLKLERWNRDAMQTIRKIAGKSETDRADFIRTFKPMWEVMLELGGWDGELDDMVQRAEEESTEADIQDEATFEDVDTEAEQEPVKDGKTAAAEASDSEEADLSEEGPEG